MLKAVSGDSQPILIGREGYLANFMFEPLQDALKAIACSGHGKMKMNRFIIEHLGLLRPVVVICDISE